MSENSIPNCFGKYAAGCSRDGRCDRGLRLECQGAAMLQRTCSERPDKLGPVGRHLSRLGYPVRICCEADNQ